MPVPKEFIYEGEFTIRTNEIDRARKATAVAFIDLNNKTPPLPKLGEAKKLSKRRKRYIVFSSSMILLKCSGFKGFVVAFFHLISFFFHFLS